MRPNFIKSIFLTKNSYLFIVALLFGQLLIAQKAMPKRAFEISLEADEKIETEIKTNMRVDLNTGFPVALYGLNFEVPQGTPESMAQYYLEHESEKLGIPKEELSNLRHHAIRTTDAGSVVRYRQYSGNYPVNKNEVTITISPQNKVVFVMNSYQADVNLDNVTPNISENMAYESAYNYLNINSTINFRDNRLMVYKNTKITRLTHEVTISSTNPLGEWHVFVDAQSGEIFKVVDLNQYYYDHTEGECNDSCNHSDSRDEEDTYRRRVDGTGMIFNPDPLSSNTVAYGTTGYVDGTDANTTQLNAARFSVTLRDITVSGGTYSLVGPRAQIVDFDAPNTGLFTQNSPTFNFTRQDQGFEPVNTYYHIDFMMDYINNTLGCDVMPYQYSGGAKFDPHGAGGADNSYYAPGSGQLSFGEGCVDDAEDSDVIHHELGHGLHDWVTAGGGSGAEGLGEGIGDYVAQSYNRGLGYWSSTDPAYNWIFNWDGHNECWAGRVTNYGANYPGGLVGQIHADGQIWATSLMGIWDQIGQQEMDKIFWEGLGMTAGTTGQNDAANAIYQAAINLGYTTEQLDTIHGLLIAYGYIVPLLHGTPIIVFSADFEILCLDTNNTVTFSDDSAPVGTSWSWTFEGGTPATSSDQNPVVTYATEGTYDVTLMATNADGSDTLTLTDYITVVSGDACPDCTTTTNNTVVPISANGGGLSYTSVINITTDAEITDVNVTINIQHTWAADLDVTLTSPEGTIVELTSDNDGGVEGADNYFDTVFDQGASTSITNGSAPFTGTFIPEGDLSTINGEMSMGNWTLTIVDDTNQDGGQLNYWSVELCLEPELSVEENSFDEFVIFPNPNNGSFTIKFNAYSNKDINVQVYDIRGRSIFNDSYVSSANFNQVINLNNVQAGMYLVKINDGDREIIRKILIE